MDIIRLKKMFNRLLSLLYPEFCLNCGKKRLKEKTALCNDCFKQIEFLGRTSQLKNNCNSFDYAFHACAYTGIIKLCIGKFKYQRKIKAAYPLIDIMNKTADIYIKKSNTFIRSNDY